VKMFAAGCVVAVLATVAVQFASSATSTQTKSIPARVKALESKLKKLNGTIAAVKADVESLKKSAACLGAQGVTQYGTPASSIGYLYTPDGSNVSVTTAFDAPIQGQTPTFFAATVNPTCITSRSFKLAHAVASHRAAAFTLP
jgi:hypothetical protein